MKRLLLKLTTENTFMLNSNFYKQIDGCIMVGPLSVIFSDIYMTKTEEEVVKPTNPSFYKRFVDDIISKKKKDQPDLLFENLNNHHPNIKYTIETMPQEFLDTKIIYEDNQIKTKVHRNERKLPVHWTSKIRKRYKRNAINADLNRAARIASTFTEAIPTIKQKFLSPDYPPRFVNSAIKQFNEKCNANTQDDYIIPPDFFDVPKPLVLAEIPYCPRNEILSKRFIKKFHEFTNTSYEIRIKWITKKVKQLFKLKSKNPHPSCVKYEGVCVCEQTYIGETRRNVELRWEEHENISKDSEPVKHTSFPGRFCLQHQRTNRFVRFLKLLRSH